MTQIYHKITGAVLIELDLADLQDVDLRDRDSCWANLCRANLYGANSHGANLDPFQIYPESGAFHVNLRESAQ